MNSNVNFLLEPEAIKLLEKYNICYPKNKYITKKDEINIALSDLMFPIVMKIVSPNIIHKSDAGGVVVNINSRSEAKKAYNQIINSVKKHNPNVEIKGILICEQAEKGEDVIIGTVVDDIFGPTIMFGLGGIFVEVLKDVTFRVCPIDKKEALIMIQEIKGYEILKGARGQSPLDIDSLAELLSKVSLIVVNNENIKEIDINKVRVYENEVKVLDARVILKK